MRWIMTFILMFVFAGCGPGGTAALIALLTQKEKKKKPTPSQPFALSIESLKVEGKVTDNLDDSPRLSVNGAPVPLVSGAFSVELDTTIEDSFSFKAVDSAGNTSERFVKIE